MSEIVTTTRGQLRAPATVLDIDLDDVDDVEIDVASFATAWCLVRSGGEPQAIQFLDLHEQSTISSATLRKWLSAEIDEPMGSTDGDWDGSLTVAICTRNRISGLLSTLTSLREQSDNSFDVLVIDNSPDGSARAAVEQFEGLRVRYCHEPTPGLSHARNRALREVDADVIAWLDDDELADEGWIDALRRGFGRSCRPVAVCGMMLPAQLDTQAQVDFERYGGFHKGRGLQAQELSLSADRDLNPLYPLPNFGAGGNMAFRVRDGRRLGGFDTRLGAGTLTHGGEETQLLARLLADGGTVLHWPSAITWHYHRRSDDELRKQFFGYSAGLTAFYVSMIRVSPKNILGILRLVPRGVRKMKDNQSTGADTGIPDDFPPVLLAAGRSGLLQGAWLYLREWRRQSKAASR